MHIARPSNTVLGDPRGRSMGDDQPGPRKRQATTLGDIAQAPSRPDLTADTRLRPHRYARGLQRLKSARQLSRMYS